MSNSRIRTIKPEFFKHEALFDLEQETGLPLRVAFAGLWTQCDREGRFAWRPRQLKTDILPYDDIDFSRMLSVLAGGGFVVKYSVDGEEFGHIPSWKKHQVVNVREAKSRIPEPPTTETHVQLTETHVHAYAYQGQNIAPALATEIFERDGQKCKRCGATEDLTVDHIFPRSIGGTHARQNLRTLCRSCNSARPVAGGALLKDLASDGLTMDDKQRMCTHVHAPDGREGNRKGREQEGKEDNPNLGSNGHAKYAFEHGCIKLNQRDLDRWQRAFPHVAVEGELYAKEPWLAKQSNWFNAAAGWLAKAERQATSRGPPDDDEPPIRDPSEGF